MSVTQYAMLDQQKKVWFFRLGYRLYNMRGINKKWNDIYLVREW